MIAYLSMQPIKYHMCAVSTDLVICRSKVVQKSKLKPGLTVFQCEADTNFNLKHSHLLRAIADQKEIFT